MKIDYGDEIEITDCQAPEEYLIMDIPHSN